MTSRAHAGPLTRTMPTAPVHGRRGDRVQLFVTESGTVAAWNPLVNLYNREGLPAITFRTDE